MRSRSSPPATRRRQTGSRARTAGNGGSSAQRHRLPAADAPHAPARARAARLAHILRRDGARALRRLLLGLVRRAVPRPEDDRRRARREAARQRRAQRPLPLLHPRPGRARDREARAAAPGGGDEADAGVPRRGREPGADGPHRDAGAGAPPDAVARSLGVRRGGVRVVVAARAAALRGRRSAASARRRSCSAGSSSAGG